MREEKKVQTKKGLEITVKFAKKGSTFLFEAWKGKKILTINAKPFGKTVFLFIEGKLPQGFRGKGVTRALLAEAVSFLKRRFGRVVLSNLASEELASTLSSGGKIQEYYEFALAGKPGRFQIIW